ncbi:hypothetical protein GCK72_008246 [Caenorhabditis remanei]|uniref:Uncharacterized protein n=1 Tax=Caenorhabditis remanei TaxID=31234 RepID=A0A6A5GWZ9_CAERE|nr:hypothetical protein GCK72_008246 [Caenorhabditis remanei]KAF1760000.1 hypothetical protein GCK72_008246 [Caenorhabditis remanei]
MSAQWAVPERKTFCGHPDIADTQTETGEMEKKNTSKKYLTESEKPYYRGYYDVVRSDDPIALNWRKPEEYPAPYLLSSVETAR